MKKIMSMFITLSLLVCTVGCSQTEDSDNHVVQDYFEEYEFSPYGNEEELDTLEDLKISMNTEKDLDLKHLSFLIENNSDKEYRYSPNYFEIEAEQSGTWYQLKQLDDPSKSNEKDCIGFWDMQYGEGASRISERTVWISRPLWGEFRRPV